MELDPGVHVLHLDRGEAHDRVVRDSHSCVPADVDAGRTPASANALLGDRLGRMRAEERRDHGGFVLDRWAEHHGRGRTCRSRKTVLRYTLIPARSYSRVAPVALDASTPSVPRVSRAGGTPRRRQEQRFTETLTPPRPADAEHADVPGVGVDRILPADREAGELVVREGEEPDRRIVRGALDEPVRPLLEGLVVGVVRVLPHLDHRVVHEAMVGLGGGANRDACPARWARARPREIDLHPVGVANGSEAERRERIDDPRVLVRRPDPDPAWPRARPASDELRHHLVSRGVGSDLDVAPPEWRLFRVPSTSA